MGDVDLYVVERGAVVVVVVGLRGGVLLCEEVQAPSDFCLRSYGPEEAEFLACAEGVGCLGGLGCEVVVKGDGVGGAYSASYEQDAVVGCEEGGEVG